MPSSPPCGPSIYPLSKRSFLTMDMAVYESVIKIRSSFLFSSSGCVAVILVPQSIDFSLWAEVFINSFRKKSWEQLENILGPWVSLCWWNAGRDESFFSYYLNEVSWLFSWNQVIFSRAANENEKIKRHRHINSVRMFPPHPKEDLDKEIGRTAAGATARSTVVGVDTIFQAGCQWGLGILKRWCIQCLSSCRVMAVALSSLPCRIVNLASGHQHQETAFDKNDAGRKIQEGDENWWWFCFPFELPSVPIARNLLLIETLRGRERNACNVLSGDWGCATCLENLIL